MYMDIPTMGGTSISAVTWISLTLLYLTSSVGAQVINETSCTNLNVQGNVSPQNIGDIPYAIQVSNQFYTSGSSIEVKFQPTQNIGATFQEIILQARRTTGNPEPVGLFSFVNGQTIASSVDYTTYNCPLGIAGSTVGTTNASQKFLPVTFTYTFPSPSVGDVNFLFTIVQQPGQYFQSVTSQTIVDVNSISQGPLITRCPGNIFLPSNQASLISENVARVEWTEPISDGIADTGNPIVSETFFEIGNPSNVMYIFTNGAGTSVCSFTVLVSQITANSPPRITTCPAARSIMVNIVIPSQQWIFTYEPPNCMDAQDGVLQVSCFPLSGTVVGTAISSIRCVCVDSQQAAAACTVDRCVEDVVLTLPAGVNSMTVDFAEPFVPGFTLVSRTHQPNVSIFGVGTTRVVYLFVNVDGDYSFVCFNVVIIGVDSDPPVIIVCPDEITHIVLTGEQGGIVNYAEPTAIDNSGIVIVSNSPEFYSGFYFPLGTTTVTYVFTNNVPLTAVCTFTVTINTASPCDSAPCINGGICLANDLNQFWCVCPNCFTGSRCEAGIDACNNQCVNGGTCRVYAGSCDQTFCDCSSCFTGANCQIAVSPCDNNQCQNGGVCVPDTQSCSSYFCLCTGCSTGPFCNIEFNPCSRVPCQNAGICTNIAESCGSYACQCIGCFTGYNCQTPIPDPCQQTPCLNGGICSRVPGTCFGYTCQCRSGFGGVICENTVDVFTNPCSSFPCQNNVCCINLGGNSYKCICRGGYTGIQCADMTANMVGSSNSCINNPCGNGGTCYNSYNSDSGNIVFTPQYTCVCAPGFAGNNCNLPTAPLPQIDVCTSSGMVCLNGGTCRNTYCSFSDDSGTLCECGIGFYGERCQTLVGNPCQSNPCRNDNQCISFNNYFVCQCQPPFSGPTCEVQMADVTSPVILNCPTEQIQATATGNNKFATVGWPALQVTDDSGHVDLIISNGAPGNYPIGSRNILYIYGDAAGNTAICSFVVTVRPAPFNPCNPNPCQNGGFCSINGNTFSCQCVGLFTGQTCTQPP
ncbi:Neurogenic locus notch-like protein 1 [Holothuria leucospilota]|uniref:Neurogenic locus notch-like protein 1 n=1 Tax=Holothuria leucospilota TaxID=206669 RepID=A0A9Q1H3Q0_HOLLE|nr:Neurogenic locus notch-like protein 1 [Holothuria leucospilota]